MPIIPGLSKSSSSSHHHHSSHSSAAAGSSSAAAAASTSSVSSAPPQLPHIESILRRNSSSSTPAGFAAHHGLGMGMTDPSATPRSMSGALPPGLGARGGSISSSARGSVSGVSPNARHGSVGSVAAEGGFTHQGHHQHHHGHHGGHGHHRGSESYRASFSGAAGRTSSSAGAGGQGRLMESLVETADKRGSGAAAGVGGGVAGFDATMMQNRWGSKGMFMEAHGLVGGDKDDEETAERILEGYRELESWDFGSWKA